MLSVTLKSDGLVEQGFQHTILRYSHLYKPFRVYDLYGRDVTHQNGSLPKGVYVVQTENSREKVGVF